jgi:hypothetical protein
LPSAGVKLGVRSVVEKWVAAQLAVERLAVRLVAAQSAAVKLAVVRQVVVKSAAVKLGELALKGAHPLLRWALREWVWAPRDPVKKQLGLGLALVARQSPSGQRWG